MHDNITSEVWLIGAGSMATDYIKVLEHLKVNYKIIGRSESSAKKLQDITGKEVITGGLDSALKKFHSPKYAIIATGIEELANNTISLLNSGTKNILVEKPGGFYEDIEKIVKLAAEKKAQVYVAYNRRYYAATLKAKEIIDQDGGVSSFHFEFTEWAHTIEPLQKANNIKEQWLLANSSHVIDHAFYLGGLPQQMNSYIAGSLNWHPSASIFSGAGISNSGAPFSYHANWASPGRWAVEILTKKNRLIFKPMEKLQIQKIGSIAIEEVNVDYSKDQEFKPGLFKQVSAFLKDQNMELPNIKEQFENISFFRKINFGQ